MKKFMAILLTLSLMLGLSVNAVAAADSTIDSLDGNASNPVTVTVKQPSNVVSVAISWGELDFKYTAKWDTVNHIFVTEGAPGWEDQSTTLKITNNSNIGINYAVAYEKDSTDANKHTNVAVNFDDKDSIDATPLTTANTATINVKPTGTPDVTVTDKITIGNIKVTISASL